MESGAEGLTYGTRDLNAWSRLAHRDRDLRVETALAVLLDERERSAALQGGGPSVRGSGIARQRVIQSDSHGSLGEAMKV